ncbi:hypothetical protein [Aliikangiella sp. G2MR2-5]|uniref:DUF6901 family protein n=1 Tax=Aliikangiella sp. G2MR2-5 TaxID=2788943 RepID=UPI0018A9E3D4|nr:hypothetical protein [Aliikangiella sp. G2MR2-5]
MSIKYRFKFSDNTEEEIELKLSSQDLHLTNELPDQLPEWTKLDYHQCSHCPLNKEENPDCPLSTNLIKIVQLFERVVSYDEIDVEVITPERTISQRTTAQRGLSPIMGLVVATSGCPYTSFFKPMAHFHLPFAGEEETLFRAVSTYLIAQYFIAKDGGTPDLELEGLKKIYDDIRKVNKSIAERLRAASQADASTNAIILLDMFAKAAPYIIEESLEEFRYLFEPYFSMVEKNNKSDNSSSSILSDH